MINDEIYYENLFKCQAETIDKLKEENNKLNEKVQKLKKQYCERSDCSGRIGASKKNEELQQRIDYLERSNNRRESTILELREEITEKDTKINKAIEELKKGLHKLDIRKKEEIYIEQYLENAVDILKEVSE